MSLQVQQEAAPPQPRFYPVVLMHGLNQDHGSLRQLVRWLNEALPGVHVRNLEVGDGRMDSYFGDLNAQTRAICTALAAAPALAAGFNAIGINQGALLLRAYLQRCNSPRVQVYVSVGGPQCGVTAVPSLHDPLADAALRNGAYFDSPDKGAPSSIHLQQRLTVSQYWRDPFQLEGYLNESTFLADLNNERPQKNDAYRRALLSLRAMVLLRFEEDDVIAPRESSWFGCLAPKSRRRVVPLEQSELFEQDWLGLRGLQEAGRLHLLSKPGRHLSFNRSYFRRAIIAPFLSEVQGDG